MILLVIVFLTGAILTTIGRSVEQALTSPAVYLHLLDGIRFDEVTPALTADLLVAYRLYDPSFWGVVSSPAWESTLRGLLPGGWVAGHLQHLVDQFLSWLNHPEPTTPEFELDLSRIRDTLSGSRGAASILPLLQDTPPCAPDVTEIYFLSDGLVSCLPRDYDISYIAHRAALALAQRFPDQITWREVSQGSHQVPPALERVWAGRWLADSALELGFRVTLLALCLYAVLHASSFGRLVRALVMPIGVAGGATLALWALFFAFRQWGLRWAVVSLLPAFRQGNQELITQVLGSLLVSATQLWLIVASLLLAAAIALQLLAAYLNRRPTRAARPVSSVEEFQVRRRIRKTFR